MCTVAVVCFTAGDFCVKAEKKHVKMSLISLSLCTIVNFSDPGFGKKRKWSSGHCRRFICRRFKFW